MCVNWDLIGNYRRDVESPIPDLHHVILTSQTVGGGAKVPLSNFCQLVDGQLKCQQGTLAACDVMQ